MRKLKKHFYGASMGTLLAFLLVAGLVNISSASASGSVWFGYHHTNCQFFSAPYPGPNQACGDHRIMSCNEQGYTACFNCTIYRG